ncbi:hypothetical protein, partial [Actinomadura harenae]
MGFRQGSARFAGVLGAAVLSVAVSGVMPAAAGQASGGGKDSVERVPFSYIPADIRQKMHDQVPLKEAASKISWAMEKSGRGGFAGIALQPRSVELWWKGKLPAAVSKAVDKARGIAPVEVKPARYSQAELKAAAADLIADMKKDPNYPISQVAGSPEPVKPDETVQAACSVSGFSFGGLLMKTLVGGLGGVGRAWKRP